FSLLIASTVFAQNKVSVKTVLDRNRVLLGEQVQLNVEVTTPLNKPLSRWFELPDSFNHIEILERKPLDSAVTGDLKTYRQAFTLTGFDSGRWTIPAVTVAVDKKKSKSDSLALYVLPVPLTDSTYHDIRDIIPVQVSPTPWWYWLAGGLSVLVLGA